MSRFSGARKSAIAIWTGASVVWATTLTAFILEPARATSGEDGSTDAVTAEVTTPRTTFPTQPASGLVIIRHQEQARPEPVTRTIVVQRAAPQAAPAPAAPAAPPQPTSSGS